MTAPVETVRPPDRYHPRVEANFMVKVQLNGRTAIVKARDLSMAGLFLHGHPPDAVRRLTLTIPLPGEQEVVTTCSIVRREAHGVALAFDSLDWDDFITMARYLHPRLP
jgi:hypothetical protein